VADKPVTVGVPEERVPEFYAWFAAFLAAAPGAGPPTVPGGPDAMRRGPGHRGGGPGRWGHHPEPTAWTEADGETARWLYGKLAPPARELLDLLLDDPARRWSGNDLAARLGLEKGAHGVAGILAWPGRYARKLGRPLPIATDKREDGGTDYFLEPDTAALFAAARAGRRD
jgi:Family of unknown function (DUF6416)